LFNLFLSIFFAEEKLFKYRN